MIEWHDICNYVPCDRRAPTGPACDRSADRLPGHDTFLWNAKAVTMNSTPYKADAQADRIKELRNEDPITGEAGSHPVGTALGTAIGGVATGATVGMVAGPIGTVVGGIIGGVAGGLVGKAIAEDIDPTVESAYWQEQYRERPYYNAKYSYRDYEPAYRAGWEAYDSQKPVSWKEREPEVRERWENEGGSPKMSWEEAKQASQDAYARVHSIQTPKTPPTD